MKFLLILSIATFLFIEASGHGHICKPCKPHHCCKNVVCPSLVPDGDLSNSADLAAAQISIVERLWSSAYPKLSCKANRVKQAILNMVHSDVEMWRYTAITTSVAFWSVAPFYKKDIDFCSYAKSINATVQSQTEVPCDLINSGLDDLATMVADRMKLIASTGVRVTGCGKIKTCPQAPKCFANGAVYPGKELWALKGGHYPCSYQKSVTGLFCSKNPVDQLLAVMATASISDVAYKFLRYYDQKALMEMFYLQTMPKIDCCCCDQFVAAIQGIEAAGIDAANTATRLAKLDFPQCQPICLE